VRLLIGLRRSCILAAGSFWSGLGRGEDIIMEQTNKEKAEFTYEILQRRRARKNEKMGLPGDGELYECEEEAR
jgi:hypothetical protein